MVALVELRHVIFILSTRRALSTCSIRSFILEWLPIITPRNLTGEGTFRGWPYIAIDISLMTFLREKLIKWVFPGFSSIYHSKLEFGSGIFATWGWSYEYLVPLAKWKYRYIYNRLRCDTYIEIENDGDRCLPYEVPWIEVIGSLGWLLI